MLQMMKSNLFNYQKISILAFLILIPFIYMSISMPILTIIFVMFPAIITDVFFYENKAKCNRFFVGLPLHLKTIVQSRYLFFLYFLIIIVLYQWITAFGIDMITGTTGYLYNWEDALLAFSLGLIVAAIFLPLFYLFRSFYTSVLSMLIIIFILFYASIDPLVKALGMNDYILFNDMDQGFSVLAKTYLPFFPFLIVLLIAFILYYLSAKLSVELFKRKDK